MRIRVKQNQLARRTREIQAELDRIPKRAAERFRQETPIDKGNARRNTKYESPNKIVADYDYAVPLNKGKSRQAPFGMTNPTIDYIRGLVRRAILR